MQNSTLPSLSHLILKTTGRDAIITPFDQGDSKWHSQDLTPGSVFLTL